MAPSATPEGVIYHIQDVHRAGGVHTILGSLVRGKPGLLATDRPTVTGRTLGGNIAAFDARGGADRAGRNPTPIQLKPGVNSIVIAVRERLTALDAIRIAPRQGGPP